MCSLCSKQDGHSDQQEFYPVGQVVVSIAPIDCHGVKIKTGSIARVVGHCDDGRALFEFEGKSIHSHSFHFPESYLAKATL